MSKRRKSQSKTSKAAPEAAPNEQPVDEAESTTFRTADDEGPVTEEHPSRLSGETPLDLTSEEHHVEAGAPEADRTLEVDSVQGSEPPAEPADLDEPTGRHSAPALGDDDAEATVNLSGDTPLPGRDDLDEPTAVVGGEALDVDRAMAERKHLRGLVEALVFASDSPIKPTELAKLAQAPVKQVREMLDEVKQDYAGRGIQLDEIAGGWVFRTSAEYAPFIRDLTKQKPVRLSRAQVETLAIIAYRQPITRPEVDDVRGVDSGPVLKVLLERDLVRILGKRDEPGRPMIYGTTTQFLEFFGLKSLKDLPTLREFTELTDESRQAYEDELGEEPNDLASPPPKDDVPMSEQAAATSSFGSETNGDVVEEIHESDGDMNGRTGLDLEAMFGRGDDEGEAREGDVSEELIDDLGADDLEPLSDGTAAPGGASHEDDGPTLTSRAPASEDEDEADE